MLRVNLCCFCLSRVRGPGAEPGTLREPPRGRNAAIAISGQGEPQSDWGEEARSIAIRILGAFEVRRDGHLIGDAAWDRPKARTLVKLLAVQPDHQLHRDQILEILWPDLGLESALSGFRKTLHRARRALEPNLVGRGAASCLRLTGDLLALDAERVEIDADRFEELAQDALEGTDIDACDTALALYTGELLPEDRYEDWAVERRESLAELHLRLLSRQADCLQRRGEYRRAVDVLQDIVRRDPLREDVHRSVMRLLVALGNRHGALRQYQLCRRTLQEELGVEPEPETVALYEEISSGRLASGPTDDSLPPPPVALPSAVRRVPDGRLIGRDRPIQLLAAELAQSAQVGDAPEGPLRMPVTLIGGEAGIGKTRLAAEVARLAHAEGRLVLWGSSYQQDAQAPYFPFVDALEGYLTGRSPGEREGLASSYPELAALLPSLIGGAVPISQSSTAAGDEEAGRLRLFGALVRLLSELADDEPLLLVLDDLQLADAASLQLLHYVARVASDRPWLILGTYRDEDVEPGGIFEQLRISLTRSSLCRHIDLLRLSRSDCAALIASLLPGGSVSDELVDRIFALSLGNPFFASELVEAMRDGGLRLRDGQWEATSKDITVPGHVGDLILSRVAPLPDTVKQLLVIAATAGMGSEYDVLRRVSGMEDGPLLDALDAALDARLLEEQGESFAFRHPLLRETLYDHLSRVRRTHLHRRLAEALIELRPEAIESIAYHYDRAHAAEAAAWLERAGDRAASIYATDSALTLYEDAGSRLPPEDADGHMRLQEKLGNVLLVAGRYDDAIAVLERAEQRALAQDDLETAGRVTAAVGLAHRWRGTPEDGIGRVQAMVDRLSPRGPSPAMAALYLSLAHLHFLVGRYHEMLEAARRAGDLARAVDQYVMAAEAQERYGAGLLLVDRAEEGKRVLEAALPTIEATGNRDLLRRTLVNAGCAAAYVGELESQVRYFERALKVAEEIGNVGQIAFVLGNLGSALILLGDWSAARDYIERAVSLSQAGTRDANLAAPLLMLGQLALRTGDWARARRVLQDALAVAEATTNRQTREQIHVHLAELDLMEGRTAEAIARLEPLASVEDVDTMVLSLLGQALLEARDLRRAEIVVSTVVRRGREGELFVLPEALAEEGRLRALQGRAAEAQRSFEEALDVARLRGLPYVEGRTLYWMGLLDLERGDQGAAEGRLDAALAIFCRLGACPDQRRVEAALQAMSAASRR